MNELKNVKWQWLWERWFEWVWMGLNEWVWISLNEWIEECEVTVIMGEMIWMSLNGLRMSLVLNDTDDCVDVWFFHCIWMVFCMCFAWILQCLLWNMEVELFLSWAWLHWRMWSDSDYGRDDLYINFYVFSSIILYWWCNLVYLFAICMGNYTWMFAIFDVSCECDKCLAKFSICRRSGRAANEFGSGWHLWLCWCNIFFALQLYGILAFDFFYHNIDCCYNTLDILFKVELDCIWKMWFESAYDIGDLYAVLLFRC